MNTIKNLLILTFMVLTLDSFGCDNIQDNIKIMNAEVSALRVDIGLLATEYNQCRSDERALEEEREAMRREDEERENEG